MSMPTPPPSQGLRPDAPPYAIHGPFAVGTRDFVIEAGGDTLQITVWYPALNSTGVTAEIAYVVNPELPAVQEVWYPPLREKQVKLTVKGHALQDAAPDTSNGPYPLVIFAIGLAGFRQAHSYLLEHLASHGFVAIAWDPRRETFTEFWAGAALRPLDTKLTIAYADRLTAADGALAGLIDTTRIAVAGHSSGGWTALSGGGAQMDLGWCRAHPELVVDFSNCAQFPAHQQEIATMLGLASVPTGLWPPMNDPRVTAVVALAPDGDIWGVNYEGVEALLVPTLLITGSKDTLLPPERNAYPIYEHLGSAKKSLVVFEHANHMIFWSHSRDLPWVVDFNYWACSDPVWDLDRAHDLINHFVTAFLLAELKGDAGAAKALAPENISFPSIQYQTTAYTTDIQP